MLWLIDNYDSFTYNIVQYLGEIGIEPRVIKNDELSCAELAAKAVDGILISPGPCTPNESGISLDVIRHFSQYRPILGVCLGHEAIGQVFGAKIVHARQVMHGKVSMVYHDGLGVFHNVPNPVRVARYHSLIIDRDSLPDDLVISAWTVDENGEVDEIMAVRHQYLDIEGVQFHPESILTEHGHLMLANFCKRFSEKVEVYNNKYRSEVSNVYACQV
jgi:anthranilate synthase/aminodeoxychorismate synthase-like glutamine amidotransferase